MSRTRNFVSALASGYAVIAATAAYSFVSVPLALQYLPDKADLGLWSTVTQFTALLMLVDAGMSAAISRTIIDHKDQRGDGSYGEVLSTGLIVLVVQAFLIAVAGAGFVLLGGSLLGLSPERTHQFQVLIAVAVAVTALSNATQLSSYLLTAHQRYDVANAAQFAGILTTLGVLWWALRSGHGVYSTIWSGIAGAVVTRCVMAFGVWRLRLWPRKSEWRRPSMKRFREMGGYASGVFLMSIGAALLVLTPTLILTRVAGLDAATVWVVCVRPFTMLMMVIWRMVDFSFAAFSEMIARGETELLRRRFGALVQVTACVVVVSSVALALGNGPFVEAWTGGRIAWSGWNDVLLGAWLVPLCIAHCHFEFLKVHKRFGRSQYVYFAEGAVFVGIGSLAAAKFGSAGMIAAAILCTLVFSLRHGIFRTRSYFGLPEGTVAWDWFRGAPGAGVAALLAGSLAHWLSAELGAWWRFGIIGCATVGAGAFVALRSLAGEPDLPARLRSIATRLTRFHRG